MCKGDYMKKGFTLIELLVVILIIGVLSAVAISGYKKAVEKSKVADALNTMSAVAKSEHGWYLVNNNYTQDFSDLDIDLIDKDGNKAEDESYESKNYVFTLGNNYIKAERNNEEYALYKLYESDNIYCMPQEHYICQQYAWNESRGLCSALEGAWSNIKSKCYSNNKARCEANNENGASWGTSSLAGGQVCGFFDKDDINAEEFQICAGTNKCNNSTFTGEGSICYSNYGGCSNSQFNQGAACQSGMGGCDSNLYTTNSSCYGGSDHCKYSTFTSGGKCYADYNKACSRSVFSDGAECIGNPRFATGPGGGNGGCHDSVFKAGSKCIANGYRTCVDGAGAGGFSTFEPGSYCVGNATNACKGFKNFQATCVANKPGACAGNTYSGDGCCSGEYCPDPAIDSKVRICAD